MKSITKLKDEARKHEQKEEWEKAIKAYLQVLDAGDDDSGEIELPLFNRVGDLYVRLGRSRDAVTYYEQAADRYAEAGLYNNAIALCNKAMRYTSGNLELLRKLGQFSAQQGFITDARRYYLEYAEKKIEAGETDAALKALASFAEVSEDAEIRELFGRKLHAHGRRSDAVHELRRAYEMRRQAGEDAAAQALRAEILALDPGALPADSGPDAALPQPDAPVAGAETGLEPTGGAGEQDDAVGVDVLPAGMTSGAGVPDEVGNEQEYRIDLPGLDAGRPDEVAPEAVSAPLEGLESGVFDGFSDAEADLLPGLETAAEFEAPADLPAFDLDGLDRPLEEGDLPADLPRLDTDEFGDSAGEWGDDDVAFDLPTLDTDYEANEPPSSFDLPLLTDDADEEAEPPVSLPLFEPLPALDEALDDALDETLGAVEESLPELPPLEPEPEAERELFEPSTEADASLRAWSDLEGPAREVAGEAASEPESMPEPGVHSGPTTTPEPKPAPQPEPVGEAPPAIEAEPAHEGLPLEPAAEADAGPRSAEDMEGEGAGETPEYGFASEPAAEPSQAEPATAAGGWDPSELGSAQPVPAAGRPSLPPRKAPPAADDFIDLGALLAEDDEKVTDTRFVVEESVPTGDEDQDFAELLSQFKQKVAEHVSTEDAAAHYDLGLAFKEMGLIDEAIGEFQIALRAGDMRLKVYEELGQCFLLKEQYNIAEKVLRRALETRYQDELELLGVYYHLARAYEAMDKREEARDAYERVLGLDINFRDVSARLARL